LGLLTSAQNADELSFIYQEIFDNYDVLMMYKEIQNPNCNDSLLITGPDEIPIPLDVEFGDVDLFRESIGVSMPVFRLRIEKLKRKKCVLYAKFEKHDRRTSHCLVVDGVAYVCKLRYKKGKWIVKRAYIKPTHMTAYLL
jgi:hypothetical protein